MDVLTLWPMLSSGTRDWLIEHNGEAVSDEVVAEFVALNGGLDDPDWWSGDTGDDRRLHDSDVDWIEAVANGEDLPAS